MTMPIIRIEIDSLKQSVCTMLSDNNKEINQYVTNSLKNILNEEWVMLEINKAVNESVLKAIRSISTDYTIQSVITNAVADVISNKFKGE